MAWEVAVGIGVAILTAVFAYLAVAFERNEFLKLMFLAATMLNTVTAVDILTKIADLNNFTSGSTVLNGVYETMITFFYLSFWYFVFKLLIMAILSFKKPEKQMDPEGL